MISFVLFPQTSLPINTMYIENGQLLSSVLHNLALYNYY